jgi:hypothetical protein
MIDGGVEKAGQLIAYVKECAMSHGATPMTEVYVRQGDDGPMLRIEAVKMMEDPRGRCIILQTSPVLVS